MRTAPGTRPGRQLTAAILRPSALALPGAGWAEVALVLALLLVAVAIRWPRLWTIPIWTDEGGEVQVAMRIYRDGVLALSNENDYNGPLFNYILAGFFWLLGMSPWVPRLMVLVLGALTVVPTYLLARELAVGLARAGDADHAAGGATREPGGLAWLAPALAGGIAALLLALNAVHVVVNSHISWGNCITPLFSTTACWLLARALRPGRAGASPRGCRPDSRFLAAAALAFGLALQTHPTVIGLVAGSGLLVLVKCPRWLLTVGPYVGVLAFAIGIAPMILNQLRGGGLVWLAAAQRKQAIYNFDGGSATLGFLDRLGNLGHTLGASLAGLLNDRYSPMPPAWHPLIVVALAVGGVALFWLWRRGQPLPALLCGAAVALLALVHGRYAPIISSARYVGLLIPIVFAALGTCLALAVVAARRPGQGARLARVRVGALALGTLLIAGASPASLVAYYASATRQGHTNERLIATYETLKAAYREGDVVAIDRWMVRDWTMTEGRLQRIFDHWLELDSIPHRVVEIQPDGQFSGRLGRGGGLAVVARGNVPLAQQAYLLEIIETHAAPGSPPTRGYVIARATPRR